MSVVDQIPEFYYTVPNSALSLVKGTALASIAPTVTTGIITGCTVTPDLPTGLTLSSTCAISGTPTGIQAETTHVISASNSAGSDSSSLKITVKDILPRFSFSSGFLSVANRGTANFSTIHTGGASVTCSSQPSLPPGLSLNSDCSITGSPTAASSAAQYTFTSTNSGGSFTRTVQLQVTEIAPSISYSPSTIQATLGTVLATVSPSNAGGAIRSCTISPALPGNLVLDQYCKISGTPIVQSTQTSYTITASNSVGSHSATILLSVVDRTPEFYYPGSDRALTINQTISTWIPISTGGTITACSVDSPLPTGLSLSPVDCSISGAPSVVSSQQVYTITGTNTGGSANATVTLTVKDVPPVIQFMPGSSRFTLNEAGPSITSMNSGGAATSCDASPALPSGLAVTVSSGNCAISGTPDTLSAKTGYLITAQNSGGSGSTLFEIEVVDRAPSISFSPTAQVLVKNTAMT
ncbi:hypothetical protein EBZ37_10265, partial [bacterium]|nr:hypothetical protein [bacterium]